MSEKKVGKTRINQDIKAKQVRLVDKDANQVGVVSLEDALQRAREDKLDLVEVSPNSEPPVCRIMNFGKHKYDEDRKRRKSTKSGVLKKVKELKFRPGTAEGDYQVKLLSLMRFLQAGGKVKITVRFRGREMAHQEFGMELLERIRNDVQEEGVVEQFPKLEGRQMVMVVASKKKT